MQLCGIVCFNPVPLVFQLPPEAFQKNTDSPEGRRLWSNEQHLHALLPRRLLAQYLIIALNNCLHLSPNRYVDKLKRAGHHAAVAFCPMRAAPRFSNP